MLPPTPPTIWNISELLADLAAQEWAQRPVTQTYLRDAIASLSSTTTTLAADATGATDVTAKLQAQIAAAGIGARLIMPPGTYKISGDLTLNKVGQQLVMNGVTINSTGGRILASASQVLVDGGGNSTFNFNDNGIGSPYPVYTTGNYNGSLLPITGTIAAGASSFVATNAGDITGMVAGDWLIVGEFTTDWQRIEWKQVLSVAGTTINVTTPFRRAINTYTMRFYRVTPIEDVVVRGLFIKTTGVGGSDNIGVYGQLCRNFRLDSCRFDLAKGLAFSVYMADAPTITRNIVDRQIGRASAVSAALDGYVAYNRFYGKGGVSASGTLMVETGTAWSTFASNELYGAGGAGAFACGWCDFNKFVNNTVIADGATVGIMILGGDGNTTENNHFFNVLEGVRFDTETVTSPARTSNGNTSLGDKVRTATRGINMGHGVGNAVYMLDVDSTVTTAVLDNGTLSTQVYKDPATGFVNITPVQLPAQIALAGAANLITQLMMGTGSAWSSIGTMFSTTSTAWAHNAYQSTVGADLWHQNSAGIASKLLLLKINGGMEFYSAVAGKADGNFATFWGTPIFAVDATGHININGVQVLGPRVTGWAAQSGALARADMGATPTLATVAATLTAVIQDIRTSHGFLST